MRKAEHRHSLSRTMAALTAVACASTSLAATPGTAAATSPSQTPKAMSSAPYIFPGNDGKAHKVAWDKHSFTIDGTRLSIWSGELHYWRLPSQQAWRDVMRKARANGFNAISLYFFWGLHQESADGKFDFSGIKDIDKLLTIAEEEGLYVIARPGPYINAEISMGGLPATMSNQPGPLRGTANLARSKQWLHAFDAIARKHQVTTGGGSLLMYQVENELLDESSDRSAFLKALTSYVRADGITVPLFTNDYSMAGHFSDTSKYGTDFYAYDSYPLGFTCNGKRNALSDHEAEFRAIAPTTPQFITEAQGGAFTPWGAPFTPSACATFADPAFTRQWGVSTIGNGVTAFNYYMLEGGTNWGWTGAPASGFTSYDYGAALDEERTLTDKFAVQKEIGYFQRALPWLAATNPVSAPEPTDVKGSPVHAYQRTTGATGPRFIGFRLGDSNATTDTTFTTSLDLDSDGSANRQHVVDDRDSAISYQGSWVQRSDPGASGKTLTVSSRKGDTATLTFTGTGISVISGTGTDHGMVSLRVDGDAPVEATGHVDSDQNRPAQKVLHEFTGLSGGRDTLTVTNLGKPAQGGKSTIVSLDALRVTDDSAADAHGEKPSNPARQWARVPQDTSTTLHLHGRDALMMTADFPIGNHKVLYTTSQPFGAPVVTSGRGTVEYLIGHRGDPGETVLQFKAGSSAPTVRGSGVRTVWNATTGQLRLNYTHTGTPSDIRIGEGDDALTLRVIDRQSARTTWQLESTLNGRTVHTDVEGAYLTGRTVTSGSTVALSGQMAEPGTVSIIPDAAITSASWNGRPLPHFTDAPVPGPAAVSAPALHWVSKTGAPEAAQGYDDSTWKVASSTTGRTPWQKPTLGGAALDSNLLGFYEGSVWYRAHFTANTTRTLKLNANGGQGAPKPNGVDPAFMQVWINGTYAGAYRAVGNTTSIELPSSVKAGDPVVLSVVVHNLGQNLDWSDNGLSRQSRGLNSASLPAKGAVTWRVRGALSTEQTGDTARTMYNNGGLYGERAGWYLPGMPDKDWTAATTMTVDHPGIRWYRSTFNLSVPTGQDTTFHSRSSSSLLGTARVLAAWEPTIPRRQSSSTAGIPASTSVTSDHRPASSFPPGSSTFTVRTPSPSLWPPRKRVPVLRRSPSSRPIRSLGPSSGP